MTTEKRPLATWMLVVSGIIALMEILVSFSIWFAPESVLETVDFSAKGVSYLAQMWAVRQFALGFIFAFAVFRKSVPMLTLAYIFFLVMFIGDCIIGVVQKENGLVVSALVMCIVACAMLFSLKKRV